MENRGVYKVSLDDWEADMETYLLMKEDSSLTMLEKAAVALLIEKTQKKINEYSTFEII